MKFKKQKKEPGDIEIGMDDVEIIMGDDYTHLDMILNNVFCMNCPDNNTTIDKFQIYLTKLDDIVFRGQCVKCGHPVGRYLETGENKLMADVARHIRTIKKEFKIRKGDKE
jgi:hypothetical protein